MKFKKKKDFFGKIMYSEKHFLNTNFFVYMVNLKHSENQETIVEYEEDINERPETASACKDDSSVKRIKGSQCDVQKSPLSLRRKMISKNKIPGDGSNETGKDVKICKKCSSLQNVSNKKEETRTHWGMDLFKKMLGKQKSNKDIKTASEATYESLEELYLGNSVSSKEVLRPKRSPSETENLITISPLDDQNSFMDSNLFNGLKEIIEFANNIHESENHIKNMIIRYINDKNLEGELLNLICGHGKLLLDSERRTLNISSETWFQQAEIFKEQQKLLQNTIDSLISQNRDLQYDYDNVVKKNEKLCAKIIYLQDSSELGLPKNNPNAEPLRMVEELNKHNDKLRSRVNYLTTRAEDLEDSLRKTQRKAAILQQQLRNTNVLFQTTKTSYDRTKHDYELEIAKLHHEIHNSNNSVKEAVEAGDVLLDDLDSIKTQLKCQSKSINWDKFKRRGKSLIDLIHLSRACINELNKELVEKTNELNVIWQEIECLKADSDEKKLTIKNLEEDKENSQQILLQCKELEINLKNMVTKCGELENKCASLQNQNDQNKITIEEKNQHQWKLEEKIKTLSAMIADKSETLVHLRGKSGKLEQEKESLCAQISGLNQVLTATGSGDIAKELASSQEKLSKVQAQYFAMTSDKNFLLKKLESYNAERETLISYQKTCYEQMQLLKKDVEALERANGILTEQLETEKKTVSALQLERVRHLEERTVLTAIYERLRSEVSKIDELEGAFCTMNQKARQYAMIAEYNKKLGEHLKNQVVEKEVAINELQHNMKELTDIHVETTKEKVALCEELAQVFNIKEVLDNKLSVEMERSASLGESKREIEYAVNSHLKEIHGKYEREHWALKVLSKDIKSVVSQRNALEIINEENKQKILSLCSANSNLVEKQKKLINEIVESRDNVQILEDAISRNEMAYEETIKPLQEKLDLYKETIDTMKAILEPINAEREKLKETIDYLQADVNNLRNELNTSRESEMSYKSLLAQEKQFEEKLQNDLDLAVIEYDELNCNYSQNQEELVLVSEAYDDLKEEYNHIMEETNRFKMILSEKFASTKGSRTSSSIPSTNFSDDELIIELQEKNRLLEFEKNAFVEVISSLKDQNEKLLMEKAEFEDKCKQISADFEETVQSVVYYENINSFENKSVMTEVAMNKKDVELIELKDILSSYESKLEEANKRHDEIFTCKNDLQNILNETSTKLMATMQMLACEKQTREYLEENLRRSEQEKETLHEQIESEYKKLHQQEKFIEDMNKQILQLEQQKDDLKCSLDKEISMHGSVGNISKASKTTFIDIPFDDESANMRVESLKAQLNAKYNEISRLEDNISTLESKCALLEFQRCESILRLHEVQAKMNTAISKNKELKCSVLSAVTDLCKVREEGGDLSQACMAVCTSMQDLIAVEEGLESPRNLSNQYGEGEVVSVME